MPDAPPPPKPPQATTSGPVSLHFEIPESIVRAGQCKILRLHIQNDQGESTSPSRDTGLILSSTTGRLFGNDRCESPAGTLLWKAGESFVTVSFLGDQSGQAELVADESPAQGWQAATATLALEAPPIEFRPQLNTEKLLTGQCEALEAQLMNPSGQKGTLPQDAQLIFAGSLRSGAPLRGTRI